MLCFFAFLCGLWIILFSFFSFSLGLSLSEPTLLFHRVVTCSRSIITNRGLGMRDDFYKYCRKIMGNAKMVSFWKNIWCGDATFAVRFPRLFDLARDKNISVEKVLTSDFQTLSFRRRIIGDLSLMFDNLVACCNCFQVNDHEDKVNWSLCKKG